MKCALVARAGLIAVLFLVVVGALSPLSAIGQGWPSGDDSAVSGSEAGGNSGTLQDTLAAAKPMDWVITAGAFLLCYFIGMGLTKLLLPRMSPGSAGSFGCFLSTALFVTFVVVGLLITMLQFMPDDWVLWALGILLFVIFIVLLLRKRGN